MKSLLIIAVFGLVWFQECDSRSANRGNMNRSDVTATSNNLEVKFSVDRTTIRTADDFLARAVFTNRGPDRLKLNTLFLGFAPILLKVQHADGTPVNPTSPPFPPEDDGDEGRVVLKPNESVTFEYRGVDLFGDDLADGNYQVRFRHENTDAKYRDWVGTLETDWVNFEVDSDLEPLPVVVPEAPKPSVER